MNKCDASRAYLCVCVCVSTVHTNKFNSFNFYSFIWFRMSAFCVLTHNTEPTTICWFVGAHGKSSCCGIVLKLWCGTLNERYVHMVRRGWMPVASRKLLHCSMFMSSVHDTIYIYWMLLDGKFCTRRHAHRTHTYVGAYGEIKTERKKKRRACNINQIIYIKLWCSVSGSIRLWHWLSLLIYARRLFFSFAHRHFQIVTVTALIWPDVSRFISFFSFSSYSFSSLFVQKPIFICQSKKKKRKEEKCETRETQS